MSADRPSQPWLQHYDAGVAAEVSVPEHSLHDFVSRAAARFPDRAAIIFKGTRISYRELDAMTDAVAANLAAHGLEKGDRVAIFMPNVPQFVITFFGTLKAGGIATALNPMYSDRELAHQLADCGAEWVFVLSSYYQQLKRVQKQGHTHVGQIVVANVKEYLPLGLKVLFTVLREKKDGHRVTLEPGDVDFQSFLAAGRRQPAPNVSTDGDDMAILGYTGGTTGLSKGAIGLHRNLVANTLMLKTWMPDMVEGGEVLLTALPLFHSYGMVAAMCTAVSIAATMVLIVDPRDLDDVLGSINKYHPTLFPGVPAMYIAINNDEKVAAGKYELDSIRCCFSASAPLMLETKTRFEELTGGKLVEAYGLTEAHVATHANPIYSENRFGIGLPLPNIEARIVDPKDPERELEVGEVGELAVRGPNIMAGYWQKPEETAQVLRDGWLYTGDIARMDEDGFFYIEDRKKDMIICSGFNVYPREVEEVLAAHPDVLEVGVAGIPDEKRGENVKAWVVKRPESALTEEELIAWSKERLARYKYPRYIEFRETLPRTTVGKVLKRQLVAEEDVRAERQVDEQVPA